MSTRWAVGTAAGDSWRGRYVHSDGYPSWALRVLLELTARDGRDTVLKKLTEDRAGWSHLDPTKTADTPLGPGYDDGRFAIEAGYGLAYVTESGQVAADDWVTPDEDYDAEWAYLLGPSAIVVLENIESGFTVKARVAYGTELTQELLDAIEGKVKVNG